MVFDSCWKEEENGNLFNGYGVSILQDEKALEIAQKN
jgi:hypothetical protein